MPEQHADTGLTVSGSRLNGVRLLTRLNADQTNPLPRKLIASAAFTLKRPGNMCVGRPSHFHIVHDCLSTKRHHFWHFSRCDDWTFRLSRVTRCCAWSRGARTRRTPEPATTELYGFTFIAVHVFLIDLELIFRREPWIRRANTNEKRIARREQQPQPRQHNRDNGNKSKCSSVEWLMLAARRHPSYSSSV